MTLAPLGLAMAQPTPIDHDRLRLVLPILSVRQHQVAERLLCGCSIRCIADDLGLADSTICTYKRRIRQIVRRLV